MPQNRRHQRAAGGLVEQLQYVHQLPRQQHHQEHEVHHHHAMDRVANGQAYCCLPSNCPRFLSHPIIVDVPLDAVKVVCSNVACTEGEWMHADCFAEFQEHVLTQLKSCGRARSWNDKQRLQNLWTKKGYDLVYKMCACMCGRGHLKKNLDYAPPTNNGHVNQPKAPKKHRKNKQQLPTLQKVSAPGQLNTPNNHNNRPQLRVRTSSFSSTGSSPPSSAGTPPGSSNSIGKFSKFTMFADNEQAAAGNIFKRRNGLAAFSCLPPSDRNPYHIRMEDDGLHGNDEIRVSVLSCLSTKHVTSMPCTLCADVLQVYDQYPLIDGSFYLSPLPNCSNVTIQNSGRTMYIHAACVRCMSGINKVTCSSCNTPWVGKTLLLGSMYSYDIFAANPCCETRLKCKHCQMVIMDPTSRSQFYSSYSHPVECPFCMCCDTHFVKPTYQCYNVTKKISTIGKRLLE